MQKFKIVGKPLLGEKYVEGKKEEKKKKEEKNTAKCSRHYVRPHANAQSLCARTPFAPIVISTPLSVPPAASVWATKTE